MKGKGSTRLLNGLSAIILVLSLVLSPVQVFAQSETEEEDASTETTEPVAADELVVAEGEESEVVPDESVEASEQEEQVADEGQEREATEDSAETVPTEEPEEVEEVEEETTEIIEEVEEVENVETVEPFQETDENGEDVNTELGIEITDYEVTTDSVTIYWETQGNPEIDEISLSQDTQEVTTVSADETSYTFTELETGKQYTFQVSTLLEDYTYLTDSIQASPTWPEEDLEQISIEFIVNPIVFDFGETLTIRGTDEANRGLVQTIDLASERFNASVLSGEYEAILHHAYEPSISERTTFTVTEETSTINLDFDIEEMREDEQPFEWNVTDVTENSFTLNWSNVEKLNGFTVTGYGNNLENEFYQVEEVSLTNDTNSYTVEGLEANVLYGITLDLDYEYELDDMDTIYVKTDGEDTNAPAVDFEDDNLEEAISKEVGVHERDITEKDIEYLDSLLASMLEIQSLAGLEYAINLASLYVGENDISDLSPLELLVNLGYVDVSSNNITDLSALGNSENIISLGAENNEITDISSLSNLVLLESLNVSSNHIEDIGVLEDFANLTSLDISDNPLNNLSVVEELTNLTTLGIAGLGITDLGLVSALTSLETLNASGNEISDITVLSGLIQLGSLNLGNNQITDLSPLEDLTTLNSLTLSNNNLSDISSLAELTGLSSLALANNEITDIRSLSNLTDLTYLDLSNNKVTDFSVLANLTELRELHLNGNSIDDLSFVEELTNLKRLYLSEVELTADEVAMLEELENNGLIVFHDGFIEEPVDPEPTDPVPQPEVPADPVPQPGEPTEPDEDPTTDPNGDTDSDTDVEDQSGTDTDSNDQSGTEDEDRKETDNGTEEEEEDQTSGVTASDDETTKGEGSELPATATNIFNFVLFGALLLVAGIITFYIARKPKTNPHV